MSIEFVDLVAQYNKYKTEIDRSINDVVSKAHFVMGPQVTELEEKLANYVGVKSAIGCGSGTDALQLALMAYNIGPGDEVIVPAYSFIATAEVITFLGAKPVFVDVEKETWNIDPAKIKAAITPHTRGIITVNMFGLPCDYDTVNKVARDGNLFVIEDAAQSFGAEYKGQKSCGLTDIGCTSFFPAKILGAYGDGGMIFTDNVELAEKMKSIRIHGKGGSKYDNIRQGINSRLDTIQAAILLVKFNHMQEEITLRQRIAQAYDNILLEHGDLQIAPSDMQHTRCNYCVLTAQRDVYKEALTAKGIPTHIYYIKPLHLQEVFDNLGYKPGDMPVTEDICQRNLALPMHPFLSSDDIALITQTFKETKLAV